MTGFKSFQELSQYLLGNQVKQFLDKDEKSRIAFLRENGIRVNTSVFGKYNKENNSVEVNIPNPITKERPIKVKLIKRYDIPQSDKMLEVKLLVNDQLDDNSYPADLLVCDITESKKDEIERIKRNREKQLAERKKQLKIEKERKEREKENQKKQDGWARIQGNYNLVIKGFNDRYSTVYNLLYRSYADLSRAINKGNNSPCDGYPSVYSDVIHQEQYILRYLYAYSCEYLKMFLDLIELGLNKETITVLSAGCGSMIDAWSILEATRRKKTRIKSISYTGVDINKWEYTVETEGIKRCFIPKKAGVYYENLNCLDYDLYCFPKSIGDIAGDGKTRIDEDFERIINAFKTKEIRKDSFFVAISMISYTDSPRDDMDHAERIKNSITERGYDCKTVRWTGENSSVGQGLCVEYPFDFETVKCCAGSKPMMSRQYENFVIYKFSKEIRSDTQR